jgi:hypothetical protein
MVGFHIHKDEQKLAHAFFDKIGYRYKEETDNPAYQAFLG